MFVPPSLCSDPDAEVLLYEYLDGELAPGQEPALFGHLATCAECRRQFDALLSFRLAVRQEPLVVPPALDRRVMARLDESRRRSALRPDRRADRAPLAGALRRRISVGAALAVAIVAVGLAALMPASAPAEPAEPVHFAPVYLQDGPLFVLDEEVTVEEERRR